MPNGVRYMTHTALVDTPHPYLCQVPGCPDWTPCTESEMLRLSQCDSRPQLAVVWAILFGAKILSALHPASA